MIPLRRPVAAEDVAGGAVFLGELLPTAAAGLLARSRAVVQRGSRTMGSGVDWNPVFVRAAGLRLRVGRYAVGRPLLLITGIGAHLDMSARSRGSPAAAS